MDIDALPFLEVYFFIQKKNWMRKYLDNCKKNGCIVSEIEIYLS